MKTVLILYSKKFPSNVCQRAKDFFNYFRKNGIVLCRGFVHDYKSNDKSFKQAMFLEGKKWIWKKNVSPDVIYDCSAYYTDKDKIKLRSIIARQLPFYNNLQLSELFNNKWLTYKKFPLFSPKTVLIKKESDLTKIKSLNSKKLIFKPLSGFGGRGIKIYSKNKWSPIEFPFIAQELINAEKGIEGIVKGPHDMRIMLINDKIFHSFVRIPMKGKLIANLAQGGKIKLVDLDQLPQSALRIVDYVSKELKKIKKKFYSIDLIFDDNGKAWIIEMNSRPGIALAKEELKVRKRYYDHLINFFLK
jgi:glutathione synthase/RimK-type ligase-like ATP-grasp enzyme